MRAYQPTTDRGIGIILPLVKAMGHLMAIHTAVRTERPLAADQAMSELMEAITHTHDIQFVDRLMSDNANKEIHEFIDSLNNTMNKMRTIVATHPDQNFTNEDMPNMQEIVENGWLIMTILDQELAGLPPTQADAGRLP